jgi:hypothetical protein
MLTEALRSTGLPGSLPHPRPDPAAPVLTSTVRLETLTASQPQYRQTAVTHVGLAKHTV